MNNILLFVLGFAFLFIGGELLVKGSVTIARKLGLSALLIGLTVVGFGTSAPELIVSVTAALNDNADIAMGNIVGSNIANALLILGVAAVIFPVKSDKPAMARDAFVGVLAGGSIVALSFYQMIPWFVGLALVLVLILYLSYSYLAERSEALRSGSYNNEPRDRKGLYLAVAYCIVSFVFLYLGAKWLITGATDIARFFNVPDAVIGLTMIAVGTSLPELATTIVAAIRKHSDIAIGNILGSNLFNILGILGITALISPLQFTGRVAEIDVWIMFATAVTLLILIKLVQNVKRLVGLLFLVLYAVYVALSYTHVI